MSDNFQGTDPVILQPNDRYVLYNFNFLQATTSTGAGFLPYGVVIQDAVVNAHKDSPSGDVDATLYMVDSTAITTTSIILRLSYPNHSTLGAGNYHLEFILTLSDGSTREADFKRICCRDD